MGSSLFLSSDHLMELSQSMDNLVIAKEMFDCGYALPANTNYYSDLEDGTLFFPVISFLLGGTFKTTDSMFIKFIVPDIAEWNRLKERHAEMANEQDWIVEPIKNLSSDYYISVIEIDITADGFTMQNDGTTGMFHPFIKDFFEFKQRMDFKLQEWRGIDAGVSTDRGNVDSVA